MNTFAGQPYVSAEGAEEMNGFRVAGNLKPTGGKAPAELLARVPSDECGCPEELWRVDGLLLLFHFEADGSSEAFIYAGDWETETTLNAVSLDDLRAKAFQWFADLMDKGGN